MQEEELIKTLGLTLQPQGPTGTWQSAVEYNQRMRKEMTEEGPKGRKGKGTLWVTL